MWREVAATCPPAAVAAFSLPITILVLVNFLRDVPRSLIAGLAVGLGA